MNGRWAEIVAEARESAVDRHPSVRTTEAGRRSFRHAVVSALGESGVSHPVVAGAILEARGRSGLDQATFARRAGVEIADVRAAEAGSVPRNRLPRGLKPFVPV